MQQQRNLITSTLSGLYIHKYALRIHIFSTVAVNCPYEKNFFLFDIL